jgi:hypothetical protein
MCAAAHIILSLKLKIILMNSRERQICYFCGKEVDIPFRCSYCNLTFCSEHRLPEAHNCINLPKREWSTYKKLEMARIGSEEKRDWRRYVIVVGTVVVIVLLIYYALFT